MTIPPPELLHLIFSQWALSHTYDPNSAAFNKDLGTLKSLRLANRLLCKVASEYLFEELILYFTEASHAKLLAVVQHPTYSSYVRLIGISPKAISGPFLDRNAFDQWFHHARALVEGDGNADGFFRIPEDMAHLRTKEAAVIDFHHAEYSSLYKKQEQLSGKAGEILKTAIGCFSRLVQVVPSVRTPPTAYAVPCTDDASISDLWQESACLYNYDLDHGAMILKAVAEGRSQAATHIDVGEFFCSMDTMVMHLPDRVASLPIEHLIADVKKLNLSIQSSDFAGLQKLLENGNCERFLGEMQKLESLTCTTYKLRGSPLPYPSISHIFGGSTWQHLRRLELGRFYTRASTLGRFLGRHKSTMQRLSLQHILLSSGSWRRVFRTLQEGALRIVEIHHLGTKNFPQEFFHDTSPLCLDPIPSSHPLHEFLFQGGPWLAAEMKYVLEGLEPEEDEYGMFSYAGLAEEDSDPEYGEHPDLRNNKLMSKLVRTFRRSD